MLHPTFQYSVVNLNNVSKLNDNFCVFLRVKVQTVSTQKHFSNMLESVNQFIFLTMFESVNGTWNVLTS